MERDILAAFARSQTPVRTAARPLAAAGHGWDDSGSLGVVTEGCSGNDSATHHLFAALSTRRSPHALLDATVAGARSAMPAAEALASALDRLDVAVCVFDADDRTACWNETYLRFFPEHVGFIHVGESYRANLRRFYQVRLEADELRLLDRYVDEGVARPADEQAAQTFSHRGFWLQAAEQSGPDGRVCLWSRTAGVVPAAAKDEVDAPGMAGLASGLDLFEHVGEGITLTTPQGRIGWVNEAFVAMYRLRDKGRALQGDFVDVYLTAWREAEPSERTRFEAGMAMIEQNLAFAGGPFELPLPGDRTIRVVEQRRPDGFSSFAHVDVTMLKRRQERLLRAEERTRAEAARVAEKSALLDAMLEQLDVGVVMVDGRGAVGACNRRAIELLGLGDAGATSTPPRVSTTAVPARPSVATAGSAAAADTASRVDAIEQRSDGPAVEIRTTALVGGAVLHTFSASVR